MKKLVIIAIGLFILSHAKAQQDFRTIATAGTAIKVNSGITLPRMINIVNDTTTVLFVKIYDQSTQPFSTSHPVATIMVPASSTINLNLYRNLFISNNMWIRVGKGILDADTTWNKWKSFPPIVEITY
jgi:hypothetical protein